MGTSALISVPEALAEIIARRKPLSREWLGLTECAGRTLAQDVKARTTLPPADVSAMDGYAVRLTDVKQAETRLHVIGEAPAGTPFSGSVGQGETVRIFTGAVMPAGADHIVIQEDTSRDDDYVTIHSAHTDICHVRKGGIDFKSGETVLTSGIRLGPAEIAVAAAANLGRLPVFARPKVALLACGDELRAPGSELKAGQIINSNAHALRALLRSWGAMPMDLGILPDDPLRIREAIRNVTDADIIVPIGGASVGDHDHMRQAFADESATLLFEKIAVKPGKPTWLATLGEQSVLGLPGNPASAYVCAHLFLRPLLGTADDAGVHIAQAGCDLPANGPRETYLRAVLEDGQVVPVPQQDSSLLTPFLTANCLLKRDPHARACKRGEAVTCVPLC